MAHKHVLFQATAREKILRGATALSDAVRVTLGPRGRHVVLDVEVQGARQVRKAYPPPASLVLFVIPPSPRELIERLRGRRTETEGELVQRLEIVTREVETAAKELGDVYDHVVLNDDVERAVNEVAALVFGRARIAAPTRAAVELLATFVQDLRSEAAHLSQSSGRSR